MRLSGVVSGKTFCCQRSCASRSPSWPPAPERTMRPPVERARQSDASGDQAPTEIATAKIATMTERQKTTSRAGATGLAPPSGTGGASMPAPYQLEHASFTTMADVATLLANDLLGL